MKDFLKKEITELGKELKEDEKEFGEYKEDAIYDAIYDAVVARVKNYTLQQCCLVFEQTSIRPEEVDVGLAVGGPGQDSWLSVLQGIVVHILSIELERVPAITGNVRL